MKASRANPDLQRAFLTTNTAVCQAITIKEVLWATVKRVNEWNNDEMAPRQTLAATEEGRARARLMEFAVWISAKDEWHWRRTRSGNQNINRW